MVDFFGNSSEMHVKLDMKAIAVTKHKSSFQDYSLKPFNNPLVKNFNFDFLAISKAGLICLLVLDSINLIIL